MAHMDEIRILIVDDSEVYRQVSRQLLDRQPGLAVVGEAANGREGVSRALELSPDVVLMDVVMPELDGIEATREIRAARPDVVILAVSLHSEERYREAMLAAGAAGYLRKGGEPGELVHAIHEASGRFSGRERPGLAT